MKIGSYCILRQLKLFRKGLAGLQRPSGWKSDLYLLVSGHASELRGTAAEALAVPPERHDELVL